LPGVTETLLELRRRGFPLVVLTDAAERGEVLQERSERLLPVTRVISSLDVGATKPMGAIYAAGIRAVRDLMPEARLEDIVFVGHSWDELAGARMFGLETVSPTAGVPADMEIREFRELLEIVS
jgi:FMN phosphatase YigB (HAD superfamily)